MEEQRARSCGGPPWHRGGPPRWRQWTAGRAPGRPPWASSLAVAVFAQVGTGFAEHGQLDRTPVDAFARILLLIGPAMLVLRHRYPVPVAFGTSAAALVYLAGGYPYGPVFISVALGALSAVVSGHRRAAWGAVGALWAGHLLIGHRLYKVLPPAGDGPSPWGPELAVGAWVAAILAASEVVRVRREQWARDRAEREAAEKRRVGEERLRIARELHDVLAHSISVINVQAGVGLALLDTDPEQARTALTTIKSASKEALGEVRQVLDTLRTPGDAPRAPAPGLDRLPELVEQAAGAGLTVDVETYGEPTAVPPGADLAAFRIVQEALTNVVRHSGSRTAKVRIGWAPDGLELRVDDEGPATGGDAGGSGNGLVGMRERAAAPGGTIEAGPRRDGGFRVLARLPLAPKEHPRSAFCSPTTSCWYGQASGRCSTPSRTSRWRERRPTARRPYAWYANCAPTSS
ncbi:sensor histidine kinase [Streptomyces sp. A3M-1-3]|uniref:sensor histidine kinase n=1 Tax=Streptomyces sp. A3M-1-3 TaxID=2962044 RepID=UPI0020B6CAC2|nr:sensor histidine kinase [Streptomyces sp. A3M-1-3]MCP3818703.1 sensor histidine kinase [Streptomyces sp. A3M-1-3]